MTDLQLCKSSQIKMQSLYDNSETGWFKFTNFLELLKTLQNIIKTMSICHSPTNLYKQSCDHTAQILQREAHRNKLHIVTLRHLLSGVSLEMTQPQPVKKRGWSMCKDVHLRNRQYTGMTKMSMHYPANKALSQHCSAVHAG